MHDSTRRRFLGATGAGVAVAGASTVLPSVASARETRLSRDSATESIVAYVSDVDSAELTLLVGEREVVVHDRDLVVRLRNAAGS